MKKTILEIYSLAVCGITLIWGIILVGIALYASVSLISPELTVSERQNTKYLTNEDYYEACCKKDEKAPVFSDEELTKKRLNAYEARLKEEKRIALQDIVKSFVYFIIVTGTFFVHWIMAKRSRGEGHAP